MINDAFGVGVARATRPVLAAGTSHAAHAASGGRA